MIKCIATDMDGTLLTATQEITKENIAAIKKAADQGVEVVVATGRSFSEASFVLKQAGLSLPVICTNGAEVRTADGEVVSSNPLEKQIATKAAAILEELGVYYEVYTNHGTYTIDGEKGITIIADIFLSGNPEANVDEVLEAAKERFTKGLVHTIDSYSQLFDNDEHQIYKLLAFSFDLELLAQANEKLKEIEGLVISASAHENLELTSEQAQKGVALEAFTKSRNISLEETMAIGDNYNDLSMFKRAGKAVAMGNADDVIKAQCDEVTRTNEESGVAAVILKYL